MFDASKFHAKGFSLSLSKYFEIVIAPDKDTSKKTQKHVMKYLPKFLVKDLQQNLHFITFLAFSINCFHITIMTV